MRLLCLTQVYIGASGPASLVVMGEYSDSDTNKNINYWFVTKMNSARKFSFMPETGSKENFVKHQSGNHGNDIGTEVSESWSLDIYPSQ